MMRRLSNEFFARDTVTVAKNLLGTYLVHELPRTRLVARIVETEAYFQNEPACHGYGNWLRLNEGKEPVGRSALLFGNPGIAYVYLNYGIHWLFNVVTEKAGVGGAVLIRAVEPVEGVVAMQKRRSRVKRPEDLSNGPGKVSLALGIGPEHNGLALAKSPLFIGAGKPKTFPVASSPRIGISKGVELPWRFFIPSSSYVTPHKLNKQIL